MPSRADSPAAIDYTTRAMALADQAGDLELRQMTRGSRSVAHLGLARFDEALADAERTHEIGVRRAVGASARDVVAQFATEAALLCLVGASAGIPAGAGLAAAIALVAGWPVALSGLSILLALLLALLVGLTAGVHPARVAARLDPVDALRAG